jgi:hypothetical protein
MARYNALARTLREPDAAIYVGCSQAYLRKCRTAGTGPAFVRIGRMILYKIVDLDDYLERHRVITQETGR